MDLPIYNAYISDDENEGLLIMSLVTYPATEFNWLCFNDNKQITKFAIQDEEQHILCGVVMSCNQPIYRRDENGFEYYIQYNRETLEKMAEKMLYYDKANNIDLQHDGKILPKGSVVIRELFFKDSERNIVPKGFESLNDGSLLCTYKVNDENIWKKCKDGTFNGFSLSGFFSIKKEIEEKNEQIYNNEKMKIKEAFKRLLTNFTELTVGEDTWVFDGELEVGTAVVLEDGEPVPDGEYEVDGKTVVIKDGTVESIEEVKEEIEEEVTEEIEEMADVEEVTPDESIDTTEIIDEIGGIWTEIEALKSEIEAIKTQLSELVTTPVATPAVEEYANQVNTKVTGKLKNTANILSLV